MQKTLKRSNGIKLMRDQPTYQLTNRQTNKKEKWGVESHSTRLEIHSLYLPFLVADTQLYKRLCPSVRRSVGPSVRWSVGPSRFRKNR